MKRVGISENRAKQNLATFFHEVILFPFQVWRDYSIHLEDHEETFTESKHASKVTTKSSRPVIGRSFGFFLVVPLLCQQGVFTSVTMAADNILQHTATNPFLLSLSIETLNISRADRFYLIQTCFEIVHHMQTLSIIEYMHCSRVQ